MNNLYGQTQILGKATQTTNPIDNGVFNYVLPYNQADFFSYSDRVYFPDIAYCSKFNLEDNNMDFVCDLSANSMPLYDLDGNKVADKDGYLYDPKSGNKILDLSGNAIKIKDTYCNAREMCRNKEYADTIMKLDKNHASKNGQYLDIVTNTNLETLNIVNLSIGAFIMLGLVVAYSGRK